MLNETWRDQYERMMRSRDRLLQAASPHWQHGSAEARDALYHFFQDAFHLKDWLKAERPAGIDPASVETLFDKDPTVSRVEMRICADLCNRTKHFRLDRPPRTGDPDTGFDSQSVNVHVGTGAAHGWTSASDAQTYDAVHTAESVVVSWQTWLSQRGLL